LYYNTLKWEIFLNSFNKLSLPRSAKKVKEVLHINSSVRTVLGFILVIIVNIALSSLDINIIYSFISSFVIVILFLGLPLFHTLLRETNVNRLEKFLIGQRKNPAFYILYASANRQDDEVERLVNQLLLKYKQPHRQALYKAFYGAYHKDVAAAKSQIIHIRPMDYQHYYDAYVHIEENNMELARMSTARVSKPWMRCSLISEIELKSGNRSVAVAYAREALLSCRGLQRYVLYKYYERDLPEAVEGL